MKLLKSTAVGNSYVACGCWIGVDTWSWEELPFTYVILDVSISIRGRIISISNWFLVTNTINTVCFYMLPTLNELLYSFLWGISESMDGRRCAILAHELIPKNLIFI